MSSNNPAEKASGVMKDAQNTQSYHRNQAQNKEGGFGQKYARYARNDNSSNDPQNRDINSERQIWSDDDMNTRYP